MGDLALLLLRIVTGGLLAGHGAQKLFGSFDGYGWHGTAGWLESLGLKPGSVWAGLAGVGELGGGLLTALGLGGPLGAILGVASMGMASLKVHAGKPIWVTAGGPELPVVNIAVSISIMLSGPGRYSLDRLFGIHVPAWISVPTALGALGSILVGMLMEPEQPFEVDEPPLVGEGAA